jgi:hypothetical protein
MKFRKSDDLEHALIGVVSTREGKTLAYDILQDKRVMVDLKEYEPISCLNYKGLEVYIKRSI